MLWGSALKRQEAVLQEEVGLQEEGGLQEEMGLQEEVGLWVGIRPRLPPRGQGKGAVSLDLCNSKPRIPASWEGHSCVIKWTEGLSGPQTHGFRPETVRDDSFLR